MGKIKQGILGGFSGTVGAVVGGSWKGIDYIRSSASSVSNPRTPGQVAQREKFAIIMAFLLPLTAWLVIGFKSLAVKMTAFNAAMSYNVQNAIMGFPGMYSVNFNTALVSKGHLEPASNDNGSFGAGHTITLTWDDNTGNGNALATDKAIVVAYNENTKSALIFNTADTRATETTTITVDVSWIGNTTYAYLLFIKSDDSMISNSSLAKSGAPIA
jgi:hypothetical protein